MECERMGQAQFASAIGIQRAAMSHIISGRNNPSLDVMTKILHRYPQINPDWLLLGKGEMLAIILLLWSLQIISLKIPLRYK
mgnify:CR=1 FL=1